MVIVSMRHNVSAVGLPRTRDAEAETYEKQPSALEYEPVKHILWRKFWVNARGRDNFGNIQFCFDFCSHFYTVAQCTIPLFRVDGNVERKFENGRLDSGVRCRLCP